MSARPPGGWVFERRTASAAALHGDWPPLEARTERVVGACSLVGASAVVLGSTQPDDVVDAGRAGRLAVEVVRRRSGGGAVLVAPDRQVWLDVWLPRGDPLWDDDVVASTRWLGDAWARALRSLGVDDVRVHGGRAECTKWSSLVCFAGIGPGEVTIGRAKVVGIAQRRTRAGARWHVSVPLWWDPVPLLAVLALDDDRAEIARAELDAVAIGLHVVLPPRDTGVTDAALVAATEDAFLASLP